MCFERDASRFTLRMMNTKPGRGRGFVTYHPGGHPGFVAERRHPCGRHCCICGRNRSRAVATYALGWLRPHRRLHSLHHVANPQRVGVRPFWQPGFFVTGPLHWRTQQLVNRNHSTVGLCRPWSASICMCMMSNEQGAMLHADHTSCRLGVHDTTGTCTVSTAATITVAQTEHP